MAEEKHYRSIVKALSWRATGTADTIVISFLITGQAKMALSIGFVELFTKPMLNAIFAWPVIRYEIRIVSIVPVARQEMALTKLR